ncbi:hypothetical protein [Paenibacillus thalictri]|uniref:GNAT family N-acetyltransferase n=1 Tax=Paenibacillus thalictri TaxID=2527873 RepID=A0A4Q9DJ65_9BACL|nr:hypothetical protein [Paenibacillus thalictri]TBL73951.1 hypothetical protein EYB31_25995 [Paenibacillus thalictri]
MTHYTHCTTDDEFADISLFLLDHRLDLHASLSTVDIISLLYSFITEGHLIRVTDDEHRTIAALTYYHGTPENEFADRHTAMIGLTVADRTYRGSRLFFNGLRFIVDHIAEQHPEVQEVQFAAVKENTYLCRLYSKFMTFSHLRDGRNGQEMVFCEKINNLKATLAKLAKV